MTGGVRPVPNQPVLHVDQPGEAHLGQHFLPVLLLLHKAKEQPVGIDDLAAVDQRLPVIQAPLQRP